MPVDGDAIRQWLAALDSLSYYDLFLVDNDASPDALRNAFHVFAESFHPDGHAGRQPTELAAIASIFRRGTEAYRVLSDLQLRGRYDEALARGILRPESSAIDGDGTRSPTTGGAAQGPVSDALGNRLFDRVRAAGARPFALRAEELARSGDLRQAKLQLVMAMHMDPQNPAFEAYAIELDEAIKTRPFEGKKSWKK